ncbi:MAG: efflux RND transporter permease subunit [Dysgonamonadaceae bacterium]|jgi:multidrug efflux pump subunit AcrB|nr:efflux RND transporter permease subunit [Dysgonamonadaceae bacterium]
MKLSSFSAILAFVCLSIAGIALIPQLTVKLKPSRELPHISVSYQMRGSSPRVIEMEVTSKLEAMLVRIKGVRNIQSSSSRSGGWIGIDFDKNTDIDAARFEVSTVVRQTKPFLPDNVSYPTISQARSDNEASRPFLTYTVNAPAIPIVIHQYVENNIKPKLAQIRGVSMVGVYGSNPMEWRLEYDHRQLEALGLTAGDIRSAIGEYLDKRLLGTAWTEDSGTKEWLRIALTPDAEYKDIADFMKLKVAKRDGQLIPLEKLVTITHRESEPGSYSRINGLNSIILDISAEETANQLELGATVKAKLKELKTAFPAGYETHLQYDATEYIDTELNKVYFRSGLTLVILLLFVLLIYRSFKYLLMITLSLAINISIAVIFYYFGKMEIQLFSLAGITISLTLVIDNTIVMSDQIMRRRNRNAFPAILAATLTTIASMVIIFFLDERVRLNLIDFAKVIMVNLAVSLFTALFLVPALIEKLGIEKRKRKITWNAYNADDTYTRGFLYEIKMKLKKIRKKQRFPLNLRSNLFNRFYENFCRFVWRWKIPVCIFIVLLFGLPVYLLPDKIDKENFWAETYNKTLGSTVYKEKIKPVTDVCFGGTLRLFAQKVSESNYYSYDNGRGEETTIFVAGTLPNGSTLEQMNTLVQKMESFVSEHKNEIRTFTTNVHPRRASINIFFTKESVKTGFPYMLKSELIRKATELGGGSWSVQGFGDGFSNSITEMAGSYRINLYGYNYDELWQHAENFKSRLMQHRRIKDVIISSQFSYYKDDYEEFIFRVNQEDLAKKNISAANLAQATDALFQRSTDVGAVEGKYGEERIKLYSGRASEYDIWSLKHFPGKTGSGDDSKQFKLDNLASIERTQAPKNIVKENQQYRLCLQYEYIGSSEQGRKVLEKDIEEEKKILPMGYSIKAGSNYWGGWGSDSGHKYWLLFLIFVIIYFMCSILFNSLRQPFAVIFVIPVSFIGIFLTFYWFKLRFDEGGFASFILLCGLSVNANIYVLNEYNNIRKKHPQLAPIRVYIKAWNAKISPIFLTVVSTVLGFIPFMIGYKESFWYPLAAGTIGGLVMSLMGLFCFLPLFMGVGKK